MAYEPTNWKTGDVVTSAKLNKLENGVADASDGGIFFVTCTVAHNEEEETVASVDKTLAEINAAYENGQLVCLKLTFASEEEEDENSVLLGQLIDVSEYYCNFYSIASISENEMMFYKVSIENDSEQESGQENVSFTGGYIEAKPFSTNMGGREGNALNRSAAELYELVTKGFVTIGHYYGTSSERSMILDAVQNTDGYTFTAIIGGQLVAFTAQTGSDFPTYTSDN